MKICEGPGLIAVETGAALLPLSIEGAQQSFFFSGGKFRRNCFQN